MTGRERARTLDETPLPTDYAEPVEQNLRKVDGLADTPGSVLRIREELQWRPSIYERRCRRPPAAYPDTRAGSPQPCPVWPCSGWGLPSRSGHPVRWWSLTPPFHPYPLWANQRGGLFSVALACGLPRVGVTHHPALRSPDVPREKHEKRFTRGRLANPSIPILRAGRRRMCRGPGVQHFADPSTVEC